MNSTEISPVAPSFPAGCTYPVLSERICAWRMRKENQGISYREHVRLF